MEGRVRGGIGGGEMRRAAGIRDGEGIINLCKMIGLAEGSRGVPRGV